MCVPNIAILFRIVHTLVTRTLNLFLTFIIGNGLEFLF